MAVMCGALWDSITRGATDFAANEFNDLSANYVVRRAKTQPPGDADSKTTLVVGRTCTFSQVRRLAD